MKRSNLLALAFSLLFAGNILAQAPAITPYKEINVLKGFYLTEDLSAKTVIYNKSISEFPDTGNLNKSYYNIARVDMAIHYAKLGDTKLAEEWMNKTTSSAFHKQAALRIAEQMNDRQDFAYTEKTIHPMLDSMYNDYTKTGKVASMYTWTTLVYSKVLKHDGNYTDLAKYLEALYKSGGNNIPPDMMSISMAQGGHYDINQDISYTYAQALIATGKNQQALEILTHMELSGVYNSPELKAAVLAQSEKTPGGQAYYKAAADAVKEKLNNKLLAFANNKKDINGKQVNFKALKGKYVLLDFWGSWCAPCRASHPHLKELYSKYKDKGFEIVGIANEHGADLATCRALWTEAIKQDGLPWIQVLDNENRDRFNAVIQFQITGFPTKILLDKEGNVIGKYVGNGTAGQAFAAKIEELLGK